MEKELLNELTKKLSVVIRVHSDNHPELKEVGQLFEKLNEDNQDKEALVNRLVEVTDNFVAPSDGCPTYQRVYQLLSQFVSEIK